MKLQKKITEPACFLVLLFALTSCSSPPKIQDFPDTASAPEEVKLLQSDLGTARANQIDVLSPHNYQEAQEASDDSKESLDKQDDNQDVLHEVALGRAWLDRAKQAAAVSKTHMAEVVTARQQALDAGALESFPTEFNSADSDLRNVTSDLEENDLSNIDKNRSPLQAAYLDLELKAIKHANLNASQKKIELAKDEGAQDFAPRSLAIAEKNLKDTSAFITGNRHDTRKIKALSDRLTYDADHLLKITRESKIAGKVSSEETALQSESDQQRLNTKQAELEGKQAQLTAEQMAVLGLQGDKNALVADQEFDKKFDRARAEFSPDEAEVYRQGEKLTIRLKGLEFGSAQSVLRKDNFPLLGKVQKVIESFDQSSVVVEGHTDSIGAKAANEKLSTERAQAVRQYLVSSNAVDQDRISAVGYGYQKPLANNKSKEGRAQNRRVDIVIVPQK